jgi:hypothetical protein
VVNWSKVRVVAVFIADHLDLGVEKRFNFDDAESSEVLLLLLSLLHLLGKLLQHFIGKYHLVKFRGFDSSAFLERGECYADNGGIQKHHKKSPDKSPPV